MLSRSSCRGGAAVVLFAGAASCLAGDKDLAKARAAAAAVSPAVAVRRPVDDVLEDFGRMVLTYNTANDKPPVIIEIDFLGNESSVDKYPNDAGQFARNGLERIGQFQTYRALPAAIASPRSAGVTLPQLLQARPRPPQPTYRLVGVIDRAAEVVGKTSTRRADGTGGGGHTAWDGGISSERGTTITAITVGLTLELPNSVGVPGATAEYRYDLKETQRNGGFTVYVGANGFSLGSRLKTTQDSADALYTVMAWNLVHIMGNALEIPYYRCGSELAPDPALEERVHDGFLTMTRTQLEIRLKRYMIVDGFALDRTTVALTDKDSAILAVEMRHRNLDARDSRALVTLLMQFWRGMSYREGAARVRTILDESARLAGERAESAAIRQADLAVGPADFNWPVAVGVVVIDLARLRDNSMEAQIRSALRFCEGCGEIRRHSTKPLLGVLSSSPAEVQYTLNHRLGLEGVWSHTPTPRLLVLQPGGPKLKP